ncbi:hypothetical protein [Nocardia ignorata]|uniref:hypothetical protein n=1 Tax=Nocardia ignorata TaxID=145285 RepID=UPI003132D457
MITTQVYLIMCVLMFAAAAKLRRDDPDHPRGYRAPALYALCLLAPSTKSTGTTRRPRKLNSCTAICSRRACPRPSRMPSPSALGDDGGSVCRDPGSAHLKAKYQAALSNGASGPGQRPVIGSKEAAEAVGQAIAVYCPQHLADYRAHLDTLHLDDTTK